MQLSSLGRPHGKPWVRRRGRLLTSSTTPLRSPVPSLLQPDACLRPPPGSPARLPSMSPHGLLGCSRSPVWWCCFCCSTTTTTSATSMTVSLGCADVHTPTSVLPGRLAPQLNCDVIARTWPQLHRHFSRMCVTTTAARATSHSLCIVQCPSSDRNT
ncbi:uncharacterized protein LOC124699344 [Lolium rigidum]|uniref:uncharacterized protein LOC124699344 n=1 Tax=Lolium rigidum TaxID=89674 RepID=UPI001F5CB42E|nr:uncharacterized protein LOC124699344 [Lolium rigidum]